MHPKMLTLSKHSISIFSRHNPSKSEGLLADFYLYLSYQFCYLIYESIIDSFECNIARRFVIESIIKDLMRNIEVMNDFRVGFFLF